MHVSTWVEGGLVVEAADSAVEVRAGVDYENHIPEVRVRISEQVSQTNPSQCIQDNQVSKIEGGD